jgi:type IV pilus assembly protein PilW
MKKVNLTSYQQGLTLIEIMIAMVIGLFLLGGVMQIFLGSHQSYRLQDNLSRMQENSRFAMDFLMKDIRMSTHWGCVDANDIIVYVTPDPTTINSVSGTDGGANNGADSLSLNGMLASDIFVSNRSNTPLQVYANTTLEVDDIVLVTEIDCSEGEMFTITALSGNKQNITPNQLNNDYEQNAQLYQANSVTYTIANSAGITSLFRNINGVNQALVENIENMQIVYGEDTNGDNTPDYYVSADQVVNMGNVSSIRISLLAVSPDDNLTTKAVDYTFNGVTTTPTDKRLRHVFSATIAIRNRLP